MKYEISRLLLPIPYLYSKTTEASCVDVSLILKPHHHSLFHPSQNSPADQKARTQPHVITGQRREPLGLPIYIKISYSLHPPERASRLPLSHWFISVEGHRCSVIGRRIMYH